MGTLGGELRGRYQEEMMGEQDQFQKQLDKLERVVSGFGKVCHAGLEPQTSRPQAVCHAGLEPQTSRISRTRQVCCSHV